MTPRWIDLSAVLAIHEQQISEHGGLLGIRNLGTIESALDRSQKRLLSDEPESAAAILHRIRVYTLWKHIRPHH